MDRIKEQIDIFAAFIKRIGVYLTVMLKWALVAIIIGICCGLLGSAFHIGVDKATELRAEFPWLLYCMPAVGLLIVGIYKLLGTEGQGTNDIIDAAYLGKDLSLQLVPSIFIGTVLTHLVGGSSGREGAALQMGGDIGHHVGKLFNFESHDLKVATMCGMAAFFSALFGTPLTAAVFSVMVISIGTFVHMAFFPSFIAAMTAYLMSLSLGVPPTRFALVVPELTVGLFVRVAVLASLCAILSVVFCVILHKTEHIMKLGPLKNPWIRVVVGGIIIIAITVLCGTTDYNGAGMNVIAAAVEEGHARPAAFFIKMVMTAVTLSAGYKGGEVVPSFFVGATFGCIVAPLLGIPAGFGAGIGLVSVFCGATNCMFSSIVLSIELFGAEGVLLFALACGISYMLSGYSGLYSSQTILFSKIRAQYIEVKTNHHHVGHSFEDTSEMKDNFTLK
ncbi:MAG: chloride channel protein [Eubacteriales bacterium]|nr:chloride channel protein [Eubacteriales bacterium]